MTAGAIRMLGAFAVSAFSAIALFTLAHRLRRAPQ
jgi:hypothetical protein